MLATTLDVESALGRDLTGSEDVSILLEEASDLVVGYLGFTPDPVPGAVSRVVAGMVVAVLTKPAVNVADYQASGYPRSGYNVARESAVVQVGKESATTTGPWLTASQKQRLRPFLKRGNRAFSINTAVNSVSPPKIPVEPYE